MSHDQFIEQFSKTVAEGFQRAFVDIFKATGKSEIFDETFIADHVEKPKDPTKGRLALPIFRFAALLNQKPPEIAFRVAEESNRILVSNGHSLMEIEAAGGFLNARVDPVALSRQTVTAALTQEARYGDSSEGNGRTVLVEYSSPNIAKPFGIGHLRSTIIGNSLRLIFTKLGYVATGINYLGDWGTQFGKMIVAYKKWGEDQELSDDAVKDLYGLYVKFHDEAEAHPELEDEAREEFRKLEVGDPDTQVLWQRFKDLSLVEFSRIYERLGVHFDVTTGESFLNDKMDGLVERLGNDGLATESRGALVVELDDDQLPPCLLKKADGATLYATRDLAGLVYRWETYKFHESLYVVGSSQSDYFKQILGVIEKMESAEKIPESERMSGRVKHVDFGWILFGDKVMKTRTGSIIFLEDVIAKAVNLVRQKIEEKNPNLSQMEATAEAVGVGAVIFTQFSVRRQKDVNFVWEDVLNFDGETGPYLQYTHARLCSLLRNYGARVSPEVDYDLLNGGEEQRVIELLADFGEAVSDAARNYDPYYIAAYLLRLSATFNKFYQRKDEQGRIDKIISDNRELSAARMALVKAVQVVINEGLRLLALQAPEEM